jgi:ABC-type sugar transport system ATPase subunit
VGPSGCGKSTALRMVAGLEDITSGKLIIGDRVVNDVDPPKDRDIAMVFQNYALYPHMTVRDNIAFALKLRKMPKDEIDRGGRGRRILELTDWLDRKPGQLSGGQRQRVAMGRAIVRQPSGVPHGRAAVEPRRQAARADARRDRKIQHDLNVTTIYVTHDQTEAMTMGDRVAVMSQGLPAAGGRRPRTSTTTPTTCSWRRSSAQMNLVQAVMNLGGRGRSGATGGGGRAHALLRRRIRPRHQGLISTQTDGGGGRRRGAGPLRRVGTNKYTSVLAGLGAAAGAATGHAAGARAVPWCPAPPTRGRAAPR